MRWQHPLSIACHNDLMLHFIHSTLGSQAYSKKKGVHQFRFFLATMRTPNSIVVCSCVYAFMSRETSKRKKDPVESSGQNSPISRRFTWYSKFLTDRQTNGTDNITSSSNMRDNEMYMYLCFLAPHAYILWRSTLTLP